MTEKQLQTELLKAQLRILRELSDRAEESDWVEAWIDIRLELLQKLKKLEAQSH